METGIKLGGLDLASVEDPAKDLVAIMQAHPSEKVILAALEAYATVAKVDNCVIQNCSIVGDRAIYIDKDFEVKEK